MTGRSTLFAFTGVRLAHVRHGDPSGVPVLLLHPWAVLLGSSSGGYVAQQVAIGIPDRVTGLVLVGSPRSLLGRPSFADEVERLVDPVDRA